MRRHRPSWCCAAPPCHPPRRHQLGGQPLPETARRIVLAARPHGEPKESDFRLESVPLPEPGPGEVLLRTLWLSLDPYMRGRMSDAKSYARPVGLGEVMTAEAVSEVVRSDDPAFKPGETVRAFTGWQTHAVAPAKDLRRVDPTQAPVSTALGVLGMPGMTAYAGLLDIGAAAGRRDGRRVAAAAGAVGSLVGQIAKIKGCRAVGIAGGPDEVPLRRRRARLRRLHRPRAPDLAERLRQPARPASTSTSRTSAGRCADAVLPLLNAFARVPGLRPRRPLQPDRASARARPAPVLMRATLTQRLTTCAASSSGTSPLEADFRREVAAGCREGRIRYREDIVDGIENAPAAFIGLLKGAELRQAAGARRPRPGALRPRRGQARRAKNSLDAATTLLVFLLLVESRDRGTRHALKARRLPASAPAAAARPAPGSACRNLGRRRRPFPERDGPRTTRRGR